MDNTQQHTILVEYNDDSLFLVLLMMSRFHILLFLLLAQFAHGQIFVNGEMNGTVDFVSVPTGWTQIPETDPNCQANTPPEATVDIVDPTGPSSSGGVAGNPNSGNTFCSGLHSSDGATFLWHEGIMQEVNGFTIGETYTLGFYQAVVKQNNCLDQSGSWRVFLDGVLLGTSTASTSLLASTDINLQWELRTMTFVATDTIHLFQFLPWDDDANLISSMTDITGGLRMGIDSVHFVTYPPTVDLGNDTVLCEGNILILNASNSGASYLWQDGSTDSTYEVSAPGTYWVQVTNPDGMDVDTIDVTYISLPSIDLGSDLVLCEGVSVTLSVEDTSYNLMWQDGSTNNSVLVNSTGTYWVEASNFCGAVIDSVHALVESCDFALEMPNVFTPNGDGINDAFVPVTFNAVVTYQLQVFNRWGELMFTSEDPTYGWNGYLGDKPCADGTYFWKLFYASDKDSGERHGFVQLVRGSDF